MGAAITVRVIRAPRARAATPPATDLPRSRPRAFTEWQALRRWGKLPASELDVVGYLMRALREEAALSQKALARRLRVSQQAVQQAERWSANPTVELLRAWAAACGGEVEINLRAGPATV